MPGKPIQTDQRLRGDGAGLCAPVHDRCHRPRRRALGLLAAHSFRVDLSVTGQRRRHIEAQG